MLQLTNYLFALLLGFVVCVAALVIWDNICPPLSEEEPDEELFHD